MPLKNWVFLIFILFLSCKTLAQPMQTEIISDIPYATLDNGDSLLLDLYLTGRRDDPLIAWIHGGAWRFGSKQDMEIQDIIALGYNVASIDFRNSPEALFPAQIYDIKAAIRFLRANQSTYGFDASRIVVWGYSSGAHLAALTGMTNDNPDFEGILGSHLDTSSSVQAIVSYSGPMNLSSILQQSTPHGLSVREPALEQLFGASPYDESIAGILKTASPVSHVSPAAPPLMLMHGIQDNQVPVNQSLEILAAYQAAGLDVDYLWLPQGEHTSGEYFHSPYIERVDLFLSTVLDQ